MNFLKRDTIRATRTKLKKGIVSQLTFLLCTGHLMIDNHQ